MPLKVDSLVANVVESNIINIQGNPASVLPTTIGNMYPDGVFITVGSTEVILDTLLIPANFLNGLQPGTPLIELLLEPNGDQNLTIRAYLNSTPTIGGSLVIDGGRGLIAEEEYELAQQTTEFISGETTTTSTTFPSVTAVNPGGGGVIEVTSNTIELYGELITFRYENMISYVKYNKNQVVTLSSSNFASTQFSGIQLNTYENFDVTTNQYLVITGQNMSQTNGELVSEQNRLNQVTSVGVRPLATIVNTTGGGRFARPMA